MINITSITGQMFLASALVMAATGEASAQMALGVIAKGGIPYYASIRDVGIAPPLGQFAANAHLCMKNAVVTWNGRKFLQFFIQSRGAVYAAFNLAAVPRNPAGDRDCELMAQQGNSSTEPTSTASVKAGSLEDGIAAADRGDWKAAFVLLEPLAKQGNPDAQNRIGYMYAFSKNGVSQDYTEAMKWYRMAAAQGSAKAQTNIGFMYENGHGVPQDYAEAMKWYRKAADQGIAAAQSNIGAMYANGEGIPQDYAEATKWYRKAADQGNAVAQNNIGSMYANGQGVPQDYTEAMKWWRKAADQGNADAQNNLRIVSNVPRAPQATPSPVSPSTASSGTASTATGVAPDSALLAAERQRIEAVAENARKEAQKAAAITAAEAARRAAEAARADTTGRVVLHWKPDSKTDPLSGKVTRQVFDSRDDATGETIQATATCNETHQVDNEPSIEDVKFAVFTGKNGTSLMWKDNSVDIEYRIGIAPVQTISLPQGDNTNVLTLKLDYSYMSQAQTVGVKLPLANGNTPVVEINPTDLVLRAFTETCEKQAASTGPVGDQNYAKLVEDLIEENARTWMINRFVSGSVTSVSIAPNELQAHYLFNGFNGRSDGSVMITFMDGLPECLYFFDFPNTCKSPSRRVVTAYAQGEYKNK